MVRQQYFRIIFLIPTVLFAKVTILPYHFIPQLKIKNNAVQNGKDFYGDFKKS